MTTFVALFVAQVAFAAADLSVGTAVRSYPLSGVVEAEAGYGFRLWGNTSGPFYGYIRPVIEGATAAIYNSGTARLDFYPLSFLGVRAGGESVQNDSEYDAHDCENYQCVGRYYRTFVEGDLALGAGPVFIRGRLRRERWTQKDPQAGDFIEPTSGIGLASAGDSETVYQGLAGIKLSTSWTLAGGVRYAISDNTEQFSRMPFGLIRWTSGPLSVALGGGEFESTIKKKSPTALLYLSYEIAPSLALK